MLRKLIQSLPHASFVTRASAVLLSASLTTTTLQAQQPGLEPTRAQHAMVVTVQHDASDAGVEILKEGGNAVDAAVAVGFALAVTYPAAGNLGGGGFMLIRDRHGRTHFLDYREKAPAAASRDMYLDEHGNVVPGMSLVGYKASGVPGSVAGLTYAQKHYGRLTLAQDMAPAIRLASEGFVLTAQEAHNLQSKNLTRFAVSARIFQRNGRFYQPGETFKQPELAETLRRIAKDPSDFYKGDMARQIADFEKAGGGLITADDLANYQVKERKPIRGRYRGYDIVTAPPPSSGGIVLVEILNILSGYDLPKLGPDRSAAQVHVITEAFRRAYMDRADYLGDPDFNNLPVKQMANRKYAAAWRASIDPAKPSPSKELVRPAGFMPPPPQAAPVKESTQTTHFSIVDKDGNAVSSTYTLNGGFGSGVTVEGLGFLLNDEMDDFTSKVGVPNVYGLIQSSANSIEPGKRPLSAMTPTIITTHGNWFHHGKLAYVMGTPGGSTIITTVANDIISAIDNGLNIQQVADAPRFHHQYLPDRLDLEKKFSVPVADQLQAMGYTINRLAVADEKNPGVWGDSELIAVDPKTGELLGGHDSRRDYGKAAGY
ncbi:gamma-glutamyltransferase [Edaphobacter sp. 12200R-103]|jgi:gamma-glutamyltranspeptidase/glutathione hydrolase|uniref:gamma-glutamyltransferase n=1 Tax=Edaphobacter sp. 12200R-103 TaxID=2703788 RepID=UPI00138CF222|nr:gamma-glutamyltransferase [Edaphobacter sp. 12200R-103]QHS52905.1 gamma-glutamyltransferase [Edaphobacter sp. 12200R-103]